MNSLFRSALLRSKDSILKESLQSQLIACVKDVQLDHAHSGQFQSSSEAAEALCTVVEAIFIHGIKESFADKMVIAMGDPDARPDPNFWPALLVFSHRELIDQIARLNFVSTETGRCRAWIRMAFNDNLLASYLQSMLAQNNALNPFYKRSAYLRDKELLDMFITQISGIEMYSFQLPCNTSLLNMWTNQPLLMSGVWSPAMKACPIASGTDIAQSLIMDESSRIADDTVSSVASIASFYDSSLGSCPFDEEEALKIILGNDVTQNSGLPEQTLYNDSSKLHHRLQVEGEYNKNVTISERASPEIPTVSTEVVEDSSKQSVAEVSRPLGIPTIFVEPSTSMNTEGDHNFKPHLADVESPSNEGSNKEEAPVEKDLQSFKSLVDDYQIMTSTTISKVPDIQDLLVKFQTPSETPKSSVPSLADSESDMIEKTDFEVVPESSDPTDIPDFKMLIQHITKVSTEEGLDAQNYICRTCSHYIGLNFNPAKVCGLTGAYYCLGCYGSDPTKEFCIIPSRVIYNWDFRRQSVSKRAAEFLSQTQLYPLFDLSLTNPKLYGAVEELRRIKDLRIKLNFLQAFLITCRGNAIESLQRLLWPQEYLYEKIHLYSLTDLVQVSTGALESVLLKSADIARRHVVSCSLCSQKGFICEKCTAPEVIYPFDLDTTYRCKNCNAVYHKECLQAGQLCPKCIRLQQRDLPLLQNKL